MDETPQIQFLPPEFDRDDIKQEQQLAILEGRQPRGVRFYLRQNDRRSMGYGLRPPESAEMSITIGDPLPAPDPRAIEELTGWLFEQSSAVQAAVVAYLEAPDDAKLSSVLSMIDRSLPDRIKPSSLIDLILGALPATREELYELTRREHLAKRPEAATRQALRRLEREGRIICREDGHYVCND